MSNAVFEHTKKITKPRNIIIIINKCNYTVSKSLGYSTRFRLIGGLILEAKCYAYHNEIKEDSKWRNSKRESLLQKSAKN